MQKSKIIIGALLLSNALAGAMWWRSQKETQYWMNESLSSSKQYDISLKENESLQELIMSQRVSSLKLSALDNTTLGKCVSEHLNNAQDYCVGPEGVIEGYQKILNNSGSSLKLGSVIRRLVQSLPLNNHAGISNTGYLETSREKP